MPTCRSEGAARQTGRGGQAGGAPARSRRAAATAGSDGGDDRCRRRQGRGGGGGGGGEGGGGLTVEGLSIMKPPYSVLAAIDLDKGAIKWRVPHGETPDVGPQPSAAEGHEHPAHRPGRERRPRHHEDARRPRRIAVHDDRDRPRGAMLRAYDKATGKEVGAVFMPAPQSGSPMTYMAKGQQYIVVAVSGGPVLRRVPRVRAAERRSCLGACSRYSDTLQAGGRSDEPELNVSADWSG